MSIKNLNPVALKVAIATVSKSVFVHPALDADEVIGDLRNEAFYSFEVVGIKYLIEDRQISTVDGGESPYVLFINDGNFWHEATVSLFEWEWIFLVHGHQVVNANKFYAFDSVVSSGEVGYVTERERNKAINQWDNQEMIEFMEDRFHTAEVNNQGYWTVDNDDVMDKLRKGQA
ncbi:hypothetical protein LMH73_016595 [Vibrio splendidus]|nr:hypothetical protein [Vibrio splendidus]MCC4883002.1 hypothetical protein [Vibrio splendidus]